MDLIVYSNLRCFDIFSENPNLANAFLQPKECYKNGLVMIPGVCTVVIVVVVIRVVVVSSSAGGDVTPLPKPDWAA